MGDVTDLPLIGRAVGVVGVALDVLLHGGEFILEIGMLLVTVVLGRPELLVGLLHTLERLAGRWAFLPAGLLGDLGTIALVAMAAIYLFRIADGRNSES